jgi:CRISPR/Cas system-associated exonuclease Cas4 (RecB family)
MGLDWSFSTDRRMRRCPRQLFFADVAAWHNARDPLRRECFLLSQMKSIEAWRGSVVHRAIQTFVVPYWQNHQPVPWNEVVLKARSLAERQFEFSANRRYREEGMSKNKANGDYSALFAHEFQIPISEQQLSATVHGIESALRNLSGMDDFLKHVEGRSYYRSEVAVSAEYNGVRIKGQIDLIFARNYGEYSVVDWKDYESASDSDARLQMCLYAWLLCRNSAWRVSDPGRIELWEIKLGGAKSVCHTINRNAFNELEDFMFRSTEQLRALCGDGTYDVAGLENFPHTDNPNSCRFCSYARICREPEPWVTTASASTKSKGQTSLLLNIA